MIKLILTKSENQLLNKEEVCQLLSVETASNDYYAIVSAANKYSRNVFNEKGVLFAQIGLDAQPCKINCKFCSLSMDIRQNKTVQIKTIDETVAQATLLYKQGIEELFVMSTAEFSQEAFLSYGKAVKKALPKGVRLVANTGDFDLKYAEALKSIGFTGVYHICRLKEGIDTCANLSVRIQTMDAVKEAGLELYYCVEPIGPEHTNQELADEMLRIRDYPVNVMAVMKRITVEGSPLAAKGEITSARLALICAVATLALKPTRAMGVHEPDLLCLMAGANQIYVECGVNPRDLTPDTKNGRGFSTYAAKALLQNAEWKI